MTPFEFMALVEKDAKVKYGICPPPITAEKGLEVLIEHFLGKDWYSTLPMGTEQVYTEAIYRILENNQESKSFFKRVFSK